MEDSTRFVPASLDEILSLQQCASWLKQPESVLREMIYNGTLKPLPLPSADYRLHARSVLLQMGIPATAVGNPQALSSPTNETPTDRHSGQLPKANSRRSPCRASSPGFRPSLNADEAQPFAEAEKDHPSTKRTKPVPPRNPEPKETIVRRRYESHGRKIEVTYRFGNSPRHKLAEANLLDIVVASLKPGRNEKNRP